MVELEVLAHPEKLTAGEETDLDLDFFIRQGQLDAGQSLVVEFSAEFFIGTCPRASLGKRFDNFWYRTFQYCHYFQTGDSEKKGFLSLDVDSSKARLSLELRRGERIGPSLPGPWANQDEMRFCLYLKVETGELKQGDSLRLRVHRFVAPIITGCRAIKIGFSDGAEDTEEIAELSLVVGPAPGVPDRVEIVVPTVPGALSQLVVKKRTLDIYANPIEAGFKEYKADAPNVELEISDKWAFATVKGENSRSNPMRTSLSPRPKIFWGDIHSHTNISGHAVGVPDDCCRYAREVSSLDFFALIDHFDYIDPASCELILKLTEKYNDSCRFVTLPGYEYATKPLEGEEIEDEKKQRSHYNLYFRTAGDFWRPEINGEISYQHRITDLWQDMRMAGLVKKAITVPHQLGERCSHTCWEVNDPDFLRSLEIYSMHGFSEYHDPAHSLNYNNVHWLDHGNINHETLAGPHYARDGWRAGAKPGVIASSDGHIGKPGLNSWGLTAVYAPELTREAIFDAVYARHTYATTGERIILEFSVDDLMMGSELTIPRGKKITIEGLIIGTGKLAKVEIFKFDSGSGNYTLLEAPRPDIAADYACQFRCYDTPEGDCMYYLRVRQNNHIYDRPVMAWSSPVWVVHC